MRSVVWNVRVEGIVQGVGFRPFVYRLATEYGLSGTVLNDSQGVLIHVEGDVVGAEAFVAALESEAPPLALISRVAVVCVAPLGFSDFTIVASTESTRGETQIAPDAASCKDCLAEMSAVTDRRFAYPFINCTNCGPRYSIVTGVPYDRSATTMAEFPMCPSCLKEYHDPLSRRFHAQPNACPVCGPVLSFSDARGRVVGGVDPLREAVKMLGQGGIVAIKGLGGYHLAVDATDAAAVERLRQRKHRDEKPFALMVSDLTAIEQIARLSPLEERLLCGVERPIVLLARRAEAGIAESVAPGNTFWGVMLPYTPLHSLLLQDFSALVMTSGNRSDEPIAFDDQQALNRLDGIADGYLSHNRRIQRRTEDSIVRVIDQQPLVLRRSRGYVPRSIRLASGQPAVLALGAELKNTICLTRSDCAFISHHLGDLKNRDALDAQHQAITDLQNLLGSPPSIIAHDLHPDFVSSRSAIALDGRSVSVQHHHAHLVSCMVDNGVDELALGVVFDGAGYGIDDTLWGGEFLLGDYREFERVAHFDPVALPGGDAAVKEPWRMAASYLIKTYGDDSLPKMSCFANRSSELQLLRQMVKRGINAPLTSSCGRLFDAVAALAGLRAKVSYEGQAALALEMALPDDAEHFEGYPFAVVKYAAGLKIDADPLIRELVSDLNNNISSSIVSARFHNGLATMIAQVCRLLRKTYGPVPVALSGGVFQNRYLTERTLNLLRADDFRVLVHRQVPPNDGGLSLGQAVIAGHSVPPKAC